MALLLHPVYELYQKHNTAFCSSLQVAHEFGKLHKNVIADIRNLDCSDDFNRLNFQPVKYTDEKGEKRPMFLMTRDGFMFLVMGYRGKKAANIKEAIIKRFNDMRLSSGITYSLRTISQLSLWPSWTLIKNRKIITTLTSTT